MSDKTAPTERVPEGEVLAEHSVLGGYRLVQQLGEGGMGVVHLALDRQGRAVALKVLRNVATADDDARARLRREVAALSRIRSSRVAPIVDAELDGPRPFIVTRWVPGPELEDVVEQDGPLTGAALHRLALGLAEGIEAIHEAGVVHRDIKPGNVLLLDGEPVLIDFGIAHLTDDVRLTSVGLVMGTPGYLAPEIVEGAPVSRATDWWGWAACLAYAASGRPPFGRGAMDAVLARVARGEPDLDGVDPRLSPLLLAALSPRAAERPHQQEVVRALETYAAGGDVTDVIRTGAQSDSTQVLATGRTEALPKPQQQPPPSPAPPDPAARVATAPARSTPSPPPPPPAGYVAAGVRAVGATRPRPPVVAPALPPAVAPAVQRQPEHQGQQLQPHAQPLPGPPSDPRIGKPLRSGVLAALLGLGIVSSAVAPGWTVIALIVLAAVARTIDRSMTALVMRRHERGQRSTDLAVIAAVSPWHAVLGGISAVVGLALPLLVAVTGLFTTILILAAVGFDAEPNSFVPLAIGGCLGLLLAWWGPGGASLRRGTRSIVRGVTREPVWRVTFVGLIALLSLALLLWGTTRVGAPTWSPFGDPSSWNLFGL